MPPVPVFDPPAIDVHAHFLSAGYRRALADAGIDHPDGFSHVPDWSPDGALALMDELGIAVALLSISSPGVHFVSGAATRELARRVNEDGAAVVAARPDRFGLLASLPLPDVDAALGEIAHAGDVLGADGFLLLTNYDGVYVGDPAFAAVMAELDRRHAVVALHPTSPPGSERVDRGRPRPMLEFPLDTTRAVFDLILGGTLARHPGIRMIVPHVGSALPALADRITAFTAFFSAGVDGPPIDVPAALRGLYYDLAGMPLPHALPGLLRIARPDHLLYGSDPPFTPPAAIAALGRGLVETELFDAAARRAMLSDTALGLFPRLAPHR